MEDHAAPLRHFLYFPKNKHLLQLLKVESSTPPNIDHSASASMVYSIKKDAGEFGIQADLQDPAILRLFSEWETNVIPLRLGLVSELGIVMVDVSSFLRSFIQEFPTCNSSVLNAEFITETVHLSGFVPSHSFRREWFERHDNSWIDCSEKSDILDVVDIHYQSINRSDLSMIGTIVGSNGLLNTRLFTDVRYTFKDV